MNTTLQHHGILGQKWGVRRYQNSDGTLTDAGKKRYYNENYSEKQRLRDNAIYGKSGVKRINRSMNEGYSIQGARSLEAVHINRARRSATSSGQVGATIGAIGGVVAGTVTSRAIINVMRNSSNTTLNEMYDFLQSNPVAGPGFHMAIASGMIGIGKTVGRHGGQSMAMISRGYSPSKFRY